MSGFWLIPSCPSCLPLCTASYLIPLISLAYRTAQHIEERRGATLQPNLCFQKAGEEGKEEKGASRKAGAGKPGPAKAGAGKPGPAKAGAGEAGAGDSAQLQHRQRAHILVFRLGAVEAEKKGER